VISAFQRGAFQNTGFQIADDAVVDPPVTEGLSYGGGGGAAPSRKTLQALLDEFRAEKRAEREKQIAKKIARRPVVAAAPRAVIGPVHTSEDDDEEALAWILESTL
jgi:hypothetical protein